MSTTDADEVAALARAFSTHLEHLREFRGVNYVGANSMGQAEAPEGLPSSEPAGAQPSSERAPEPSPERAPEASPERAPDTSPRVRAPDPQVPDPAPAARLAPAPTPASNTVAAQPAASRARDWSAAQKLQFLRDHIGDCRRCGLCEGRTNIVFGVGNPDADLMIVGEAPGAQEDRRGEPFVGPAGQRLTHWIEWLGFRREQVYIANVIKCRPPGNRDPLAVEIGRCSPFLHAQVRAIQPRVIVAVGRFAGCLMLGRDQKMYEMRGQLHRYREPKTKAEFPLVVTYHPAYVLRREREGPRRGAQPDRGGTIKSEDQKVLDDLSRAGSLLRG